MKRPAMFDFGTHTPCGDPPQVGDLVGHTLIKIEGMTKGSGEIVFTLDNGWRVVFYHSQQCCESVEVEDVCGNPADLVGSPLLMAECVTNEADIPNLPEPQSSWSEVVQWTFYKFATVEGYVTVRWMGESNGYYGTDVEMELQPPRN